MMKKMRQRGALFVEFALILPLFLLICFSVIYFGMYLHDIYAVNELARYGVRYAAVEESSKSTEYANQNDAGDFSKSKKYTNVQTELGKRIKDTPVILFEVQNIGQGSLSKLEPKDETINGKIVKNVVIKLHANRKSEAFVPLLLKGLIPGTIEATLTMRLEPET